MDQKRVRRRRALAKQFVGRKCYHHLAGSGRETRAKLCTEKLLKALIFCSKTITTEEAKSAYCNRIEANEKGCSGWNLLESSRLFSSRTTRARVQRTCLIKNVKALCLRGSLSPPPGSGRKISGLRLSLKLLFNYHAGMHRSAGRAQTI